MASCKVQQSTRNVRLSFQDIRGLRARVGSVRVYVKLRQPKILEHPGSARSTDPRANFRRIERREWWLWTAAAINTLLLTIGLASFLLPNAHLRQDFYSVTVLPQAMRGLVALVFLFDLY